MDIKFSKTADTDTDMKSRIWIGYGYLKLIFVHLWMNLKKTVVQYCDHVSEKS